MKNEHCMHGPLAATAASPATGSSGAHGRRLDSPAIAGQPV
jgi:hypothetical protein